MTNRRLLGVLLSIAIAVPSGATPSATGTVRGMVSLSGHGLQGLSLTLVNVETGKAFAVRTAADGSFTAVLPAGSYVFSSPGRAGVSISRAPLSVEVFSGKVASANVELASLSVASLAQATGSATITHAWVDCIIEQEFTLITAIFEPVSSVVNGRLYFQSNLSPEWFYTEFEKIEPFVAGGPTHQAFIPKVNKDSGIETINYYLQVTASDFADTKSQEKATKVVAEGAECQGVLAAIGTPAGSVSVLSGSGAPAALLGMSAGVGLGAVAVGAIIVGVVAVGAGVAAVAIESTPTPTPPVVATPTPTPVPPTPTPTPTVTLCTVNWVTATAGPSCRVGATNESTNQVILVPSSGSGTLLVTCTSRIRFDANVAPASSLTTNSAPANWSQSCGERTALGSPCFTTGPAQVNLTCLLK